LSTGQPELAAPPPRPACGDRAKRAFGTAPRLGQPGHFGQWAELASCGLGPNSAPGLCGGFIFHFRLLNEKFQENRIRIQKSLGNEIQLRKMQYKFWMNPQQ
jgi:hypothetical protein